MAFRSGAPRALGCQSQAVGLSIAPGSARHGGHAMEVVPLGRWQQQLAAPGAFSGLSTFRTPSYGSRAGRRSSPACRPLRLPAAGPSAGQSLTSPTTINPLGSRTVNRYGLHRGERYRGLPAPAASHRAQPAPAARSPAGSPASGPARPAAALSGPPGPCGRWRGGGATCRRRGSTAAAGGEGAGWALRQGGRGGAEGSSPRCRRGRG